VQHARERKPTAISKRGTGGKGRSGTGIGLAVVAELAAAHGGTVTAASPPDGGAVFTVTPPAA
jgi:signal transduction histidine kinase